MGQTLKTLSDKPLAGSPVFSNRFVTEICETVHVHYRNLRIMLSVPDWLTLTSAMAASVERYNKRGCPSPDAKNHIELCRKQVAVKDDSNSIKINLNKNLYNLNKGKVFAEGANIEDEEYIHLKIRDLRLELSKDEFKTLAEAVKEADEKLKSSDSGSMLQTS